MQLDLKNSDINRKRKSGSEDQIFGIDEFIERSSHIKKKWFLQNMNNLRKVEKKFRKAFLQIEFSDIKEFKENEEYIKVYDVWQRIMHKTWVNVRGCISL